jgi:hypothetical protein
MDSRQRIVVMDEADRLARIANGADQLDEQLEI